MAGRRRHTALSFVAVTALASLSWDRRTWEHVIMVAIGLAAAAGLARETQTRSLGRLLGWDERQYQSHLRTVENNQA